MNVLVIQRQSLVAKIDFSLSVYARIVEAMDWLSDHGLVQYASCGEFEECVWTAMQWADIVVFNKHFSEGAIGLATKAKQLGKRTLLDIDDLVTAFPSYSGGKQSNNEENFIKMLTLMDTVSVANTTLLDAMQPYRSDCILIPNGIYVEKYPTPIMDDAYPPRCVFTNADYLKIRSFKSDFLRVLHDFHDTHPEVSFDFFGDPFPELDSLPFIHYICRTPYDEYINCLAKNGYMFAITPLGADEDKESAYFNSCKNPFKYLNYGVAGIPGIYSDAKIYRDCVTHGETGILVENTYDSWMAAMEKMITDSELREHVVNNAMQNIKLNYNIKDSAQQYYKLMVEI